MNEWRGGCVFAAGVRLGEVSLRLLDEVALVLYRWSDSPQGRFSVSSFLHDPTARTAKMAGVELYRRDAHDLGGARVHRRRPTDEVLERILDNARFARERRQPPGRPRHRRPQPKRARI